VSSNLSRLAAGPEAELKVSPDFSPPKQVQGGCNISLIPNSSYRERIIILTETTRKPRRAKRLNRPDLPLDTRVFYETQLDNVLIGLFEGFCLIGNRLIRDHSRLEIDGWELAILGDGLDIQIKSSPSGRGGH
jgi:hypothetical protein